MATAALCSNLNLQILASGSSIEGIHNNINRTSFDLSIQSLQEMPQRYVL
jgi:hypothetical protein